MMVKTFKHTYNYLLLLGSLFILLSSFHSGIISTMKSEDTITAAIKEKYMRDATRLALRHASKGSDYHSVEIEAPRDMVISIYNALIAVHQTSGAESNLVTKVHKLHTFPVPSVDNFQVIYERNAKWATPLRLGDCSTTNDEINGLVEKYDLLINNNIEWDDDHNSFNVRSSQSLNIAPIASSFSNISGIYKTDLLVPSGDGNDIEVTKNENTWTISYIIKFDSCFSSCKKQHRWVFEVEENGKVNFIEESGDELPSWMKK